MYNSSLDVPKTNLIIRKPTTDPIDNAMIKPTGLNPDIILRLTKSSSILLKISWKLLTKLLIKPSSISSKMRTGDLMSITKITLFY